MARRISTGIAGKNVLGSIVAVQNSLRSVINNENVVLQATGTGITTSATDFQVDDGNSLRLADDDGSNYVALTAPATVASNVTLTFPATAGTDGYALVTDGNGVLSWEETGVSIIERTVSDNNPYYIAMTDQTTGAETILSIASDRFSFVPNPGLLTVNSVAVSSNTTSSNTTSGALVVTGGVGVGGQVTCTSLSAGSITETSSIILKENILPIDNALDKILSLKGVNYTRKSNGKYEVGLIAEEVEKIVPELVDDSGTYKSIHYGRLSAYLIEAIKYLKQEMDKV